MEHPYIGFHIKNHGIIKKETNGREKTDLIFQSREGITENSDSLLNEQYIKNIYELSKGKKTHNVKLIVYYEEFSGFVEDFYIDDHGIVHNETGINEIGIIIKREGGSFEKLNYTKYQKNYIIGTEHISRILQFKISDFIDFIEIFKINITPIEKIEFYYEDDCNEGYFSCNFKVKYSKTVVYKEIINFLNSCIITDYSPEKLKQILLNYFQIQENKYGMINDFFRINLLDIEDYFLDKRSVYLFLLLMNDEKYIKLNDYGWDHIKLKNKTITEELVKEDSIKLGDSIYYYPQKYLFQNPKNNKDYNIKDHGNYDKMMDILLKNKGKFVTYNEFIETSGMKLLSKSDSREPQKRITDSKGLLLNHVSKKLGIEKIEFIKRDNGLKLVIL